MDRGGLAEQVVVKWDGFLPLKGNFRTTRDSQTYGKYVRKALSEDLAGPRGNFRASGIVTHSQLSPSITLPQLSCLVDRWVGLSTVDKRRPKSPRELGIGRIWVTSTERVYSCPEHGG